MRSLTRFGSHERYRYALERTATGECALAYAYDRVGNSHRGNSCATRESIFFYLSYGIGDNKFAFYFLTADIKRSSASRYIAETVYTAPARYIAGVIYRGQSPAIIEGIISYAFDRVGYRHRGEHRATVKSAVQDIPARYRDAAKARRYVIIISRRARNTLTVIMLINSSVDI